MVVGCTCDARAMSDAVGTAASSCFFLMLCAWWIGRWSLSRALCVFVASFRQPTDRLLFGRILSLPIPIPILPLTLAWRLQYLDKHVKVDFIEVASKQNT